MFKGCQAWFSHSVQPGPRQLWVAGGGLLARWQDADYLFSSDATHPDTRSIHESLEYLDGRATVFHPCYLSAWVNSSTAKQQPVALGHFVLPPTCLQEEIRRKIGRFLWEQMDDSLVEQPEENLSDEPETVSKECEQGAGEDAQNLPESSEGKKGSRSSSQAEVPCHALQEYPINNMVTGYTSARDMRKYIGELHDFIPGTAGYTAYWVHHEISLCSDVKTKKILNNRQLFSAKP
ncbi:telomere repeats-binding bouquet formation protein 2 isoform X1 [Phasianus colchicus]|uniref:telomere repeats-binding bouquet formation protein 2 isoform X1 n=1 Tax=Phasianus colchicus TaxID=9054 RepID=UPI00129D8C81|nr:telomere repeats-binding bouquet formation protein 2 isoform X1 [Phasianus colchicus]